MKLTKFLYFTLIAYLIGAFGSFAIGETCGGQTATIVGTDGDDILEGGRNNALTSLAGDADVAAGRQAGVDDYQIKLDRSALLDSIKQLTQGGRVLAESSAQESAEELARRADSASASTACEYVSFHLNDLLLGVDIDHIQEIHRHLEVTPIPGVPDHVRGVMNLRGEVVTILDPKQSRVELV